MYHKTCGMKTLTLYKNEGDRSDCNNNHCISILSAVGKLFARVALRSFQVFAENLIVGSEQNDLPLMWSFP